MKGGGGQRRRTRVSTLAGASAGQPQALVTLRTTALARTRARDWKQAEGPVRKQRPQGAQSEAPSELQLPKPQLP